MKKLIHLSIYAHAQIYIPCYSYIHSVECIYTYIHIHIHTYTYVRTCIHTSMHTCIHAYARALWVAVPPAPGSRIPPDRDASGTGRVQNSELCESLFIRSPEGATQSVRAPCPVLKASACARRSWKPRAQRNSASAQGLLP